MRKYWLVEVIENDCIVTSVRVYNEISPEPSENPTVSALGISLGLRQYFIVYPSSRHNTVISISDTVYQIVSHSIPDSPILCSPHSSALPCHWLYTEPCPVLPCPTPYPMPCPMYCTTSCPMPCPTSCLTPCSKPCSTPCRAPCPTPCLRPCPTPCPMQPYPTSCPTTCPAQRPAQCQISCPNFVQQKC